MNQRSVNPRRSVSPKEPGEYSWDEKLGRISEIIGCDIKRIGLYMR